MNFLESVGALLTEWLSTIPVSHGPRRQSVVLLSATYDQEDRHSMSLEFASASNEQVRIVLRDTLQSADLSALPTAHEMASAVFDEIVEILDCWDPSLQESFSISIGQDGSITC